MNSIALIQLLVELDGAFYARRKPVVILNRFREENGELVYFPKARNRGEHGHEEKPMPEFNLLTDMENHLGTLRRCASGILLNSTARSKTLSEVLFNSGWSACNGLW
jgi:hypothetical protein